MTPESSEPKIVTRAQMAAALEAAFGTSHVAWSVQAGSPDDVAGQGTWLGFFQPDIKDNTVLVGRGDQKFFQVRLRKRPEGYDQPIIFEEPRMPSPTNGRPRVVGYVRVYINPRGYVLTKSETTLEGETLMIHPTSISKEDVIPEDARLLGSWFFHTNPQRIEGTVEIELLHRDFPDDDPSAMMVRQVAVLTDDGRTLSMTAKIMVAANA